MLSYERHWSTRCLFCLRRQRVERRVRVSVFTYACFLVEVCGWGVIPCLPAYHSMSFHKSIGCFVFNARGSLRRGG